MDMKLPWRQYVIHKEQRDWFQRESVARLPEFNKEYADRVIKFIDRHHIKLKDTLYASNTPTHLHYIGFVFNYYQSFRRAYAADPERAITHMHKSYVNLLTYLDKSQRDTALASFYAMTLEKPDKTGLALSYAAHYTIATVFFILYSSLHKYRDWKTPGYDDGGVFVSADALARKILLRTMADIERQGLIKIDPNTPEGA